jgi:hypothetical protein
MGLRSSKNSYIYDRQVLIDSNRCSTSLVEILGYLNGDDTMERIKSTIATNWNYRGNAGSKKELVVVMCTAATSGQGKTELCRQMTLCNDLAENLPNISMVIAIPISFNLYSTFANSECIKSIESALTWRILVAFGNKNVNESTPEEKLPSLYDALKSIRKKNCPKGRDINSVGIILMLDEIMKIRDKNEKFFEDVLDFVTNLQQRDLRDSVPTFVFITSLELAPVSHHVVTKSGRRLLPIPMPFLNDLDLQVVASKIYDILYSVLCEGRPINDRTMLERYNNLNNLVRITVSISGRHFRTLEDSVRAIYGRLVTREQHAIAERANKTKKILTPSDDGPRKPQLIATTADVFSGKGAAVDMSIKDIFDHVVNLIETGGVDCNMCTMAKNLFLDSINEPNLLIEEESIHMLEAAKLVFIKFRDPARAAYVNPRVSLPFLYLYPRSYLDRRLAPPGGNVKNQDEQRRQNILSSRHLRLPEPARLTFHEDMILHNIGVELSRPFKELSDSFERVVPLAELLTVAARLRFPSRVIDVQDILPNSIFKPWGNESLAVSPFVLTDDVAVETHASNVDGSPSGEVRAAVQLALDSSCNSVYICQGKVKMECIEYVSRLFSVRGKQVLCFSSMKFREKSDPVRLARELHEFVKAKVDIIAPNKAASPQYYAVIYCCIPKENVHVDDLPSGTLIVPFESIRDLLYPFGLNQLILNAEEKFSKS